MDFPVILENGSVHDIDELSSGEKEILFGYLCLRNSAPKNSIVMIDEPELHLNPALIRGLPQFYHRHVGRALGNQLWLTTHSDALLREAVGQPEFSVFHMQFADSIDDKGNQLQPIDTGKTLNRALIGLVGDLATYRPSAKVVFFEGGGDSNFDIRMVSTLFPNFARAVNPISVGDRVRVERLHGLLRKAAEAGELGTRFFSVVDKDSGAIDRAADSYVWDRYHIENYLMEPKYILAVLRDLGIAKSGLENEAAVKEKLRQCADCTLNGLVRHELEQTANRMLISAINTNIPRNNMPIAPALQEAVEASEERVRDAVNRHLSYSNLSTLEKKARARFSKDLKSNRWLITYRGREVLKCFCDKYVRKIGYEPFRNCVLAKMRDESHQPTGMKKVVEAILKT